MKLYHRTAHADAILGEGFRDTEGTWGFTTARRGVWVSAGEPLTSNEGAAGDDVLVIEMPDTIVAPFEVIEDGKPYREFLVPADVLNAHPIAQLWECEGCEETLIQPEQPNTWLRLRGRSVVGEPMTITLCDVCAKQADLLRHFIPN